MPLWASLLHCGPPWPAPADPLRARPRPGVISALGAVQALGTVFVHHARHRGRQPWRHRPSECGRCASASVVDVSEDDLRAIAKRGYEGALTTDHDQPAHAVALFLTDAVVQLDLG
jgi:hypothetical protein